MIFKEFLSEYTWYNKYLQAADICKDDGMMNEMLSDIWFNHGRSRATEEEIIDFYKDNILYSSQLINRLPMDKEVSLKSIAEVNQGYIQDIAKLFRHTYYYVIDYGCGIGVNGFTFSYYGYKVALWDITSPHFQVVVDLARKGFNFNKTFDGDYNSIMDVAWIDKGDWDISLSLVGRADVIICTQVLEHVKDPVGRLREFYEMLNNGGMLILETFFSDNVPYHLKEHVDNHFCHPSYWLRTVMDVGFSPLIEHESGEVRVWIK